MSYFHKQFMLMLPSLLVANLMSGQGYDTQEIPFTLLENADVVVRKKNLEVRIESLEEIEVERSYCYTLLNENAERFNYAISRNSELLKCEHMSGKLYDAQGKVLRKNDKGEVKKVSGNDADAYSDGVTQFLSLKHNQYPYTVEYKVKEVYRSLLLLPKWVVQEEGMSVQSSKCSVAYPKHLQVRAKLIGFNTQAEVLEDNDKTSIWNAEMSNLAAMPSEILHKKIGPHPKYAYFVPKEMKIKEFKGPSDTWSDFGKILFALNDNRDQVSSSMQAEVQEMVKNTTSTRQKIEILYDYLKANYRYVSVQIAEGGWQTFPASYVEQKKFGDCKALSNYMKGLLKAAGIEAQLCAVEAGYSDYTTKFEADAPTNQFNHMILYVPSEDLWLECTSSTLPAGYLGSFTQNRQALILTAQGGVLKQTPISGISSNKQANHIKIQLSDQSGMASIASSLQVFGQYAEPWYALQFTESDKIKKQESATAWIKMLATKMGSLQIDIDKKSAKATIQFDLTSKYANKFGNRLNIPLHKTNAFDITLPSDTARVFDIWSDKAFHWIDTISIALPADYQFEAIPSESSFSGVYGSYEKKMQKISDRELICIREITLHHIDAPKTAYSEIREWFNKLRTADLEAVVAVQVKRP